MPQSDSTKMHSLSRYIQTTHLLHATTALSFPHDTHIRFFSEEEANELSALVRKRNVFARHSWENNFYLQRIGSLGNRTVIETLRPGDPDDMILEAQSVADWAEKTALLSSTLAVDRKKLHRRLGMDVLRQSEMDITIGREFKYLRSKSRRRRGKHGLELNKTFSNHFNRCGFPGLYLLCIDNTGASSWMQLALGWIYESRLETHPHAAVVKTAIALESLLIFSETESLARSLSERAAFILSPDPKDRERISSIVKRFYEARSGVVHGSRKKSKKLTLNLLEGMDRLVVLLCLVIAANADKWVSKDALRQWCENERWGKPSSATVPFPASQLKSALALCDK